MNRKLLPYEHELVKALGVTEEEYLDFLAVQHDYSRSAEEKLQELRGEPVSITLAIVGILFQIASVLLMPKPPDPKNQTRPRDVRFAPRFGFNSTQELAQYGEPLNLVYCNTRQNPKGAVRANMSLVWSAVENYGASQFMQMLLVVGAAKVKGIDFQKVAFGQLPISDFGSTNAWIYYQENGSPRFSDRKLGDTNDPTRDGAAANDSVCRLLIGANRKEGYSQASSPSAKTSIGVHSVIPINVSILERDSKGRIAKAQNEIEIRGNSWGGSNGGWKVGDTFTLILKRTEGVSEDVTSTSLTGNVTAGVTTKTKTSTEDKKNAIAIEAANDMRYQYASSLDLGSVYMLGTAKFKLAEISGDQDLDNVDVVAKFRCIEAGRHPKTAYDRKEPPVTTDDELEQLEEDLEKLLNPNEGKLSNADAIRARASFSSESREFLKQKFPAAIIDWGNVDFNFSSSTTVAWTNDLDVKRTYVVSRKGSLAYTQALLKQFLADKPKLSVARLRKEYQSDLTKGKRLRDRVLAGKYDRQLRKIAARFSEAIKAIDEKIETLQEKIEDTPTTTAAGKKKIAEYRKRISALRDDRREVFDEELSVIRQEYFDYVYEAKTAFNGIDGNRYAAGIEVLEDRIAGLKGDFVVDQIGVDAIKKVFNELIDEKELAIDVLKYATSNWGRLKYGADDAFFNKCLAKADSGAYQCITDCNYVKFALKCRIFRRISGRQTTYGSKKAPDGYRLSDNGTKGRIAFFRMLYKQPATPTYEELPIIFAVRRGVDQDNFIGLTFKGDSKKKWQFKFEPIGDILAELEERGQKTFAFIENSGKRREYKHNGSEISWVGDRVTIGFNAKLALKERGPVDTNEWDLFSVESDTQIQFSFDNGPEFSLTAVTEQQTGGTGDKYKDMSTMAFGVYSGRGVQDLRSVSAYVTEGKASWVVNQSTGATSLSSSSTSYAPDVFADTVLDTENGIGKYAKPEGIAWDLLALSKRFCKYNGLGCDLFMDGVIAEQQPWRQFWAEVAPYSLLEFARIGGKEALVPAVPVNKDGVADRKVTISALFNAGNILEGSYKEEFLDYGSSTQDLIATVIYRDTEDNDVFPRNVSVDVLLKDVDEKAALRQTFNISQFVTQREQAILFGKLLCNQRRWIRRGIEFQTFPTDSPISPGAYIYVDIGLNTWDRITSGVIMSGGVLNAPLTEKIADGTYSVLVYKSGGKVQDFDSVQVSGGAAASLADKEGHLFVLGAKADRKRVFRVTEVQMDEEGQVTVKAMEHPCQTSGSDLLSRVANFSDSLFTVR